MKKINSLDAFTGLQEKLKAAVIPGKKVITICGDTGCSAFGAHNIYEECCRELAARGRDKEVEVKMTGCHGFCVQGPLLVILPEKIFYPHVQPEDIPRIVEKTVLNNEIIEELLYTDPRTGKQIIYNHEIPFYSRQQRQVFRLNGILDPASLEDYILHDGYAALLKVLREMNPEAVINEVKEAGLRGRGGAGFPAGLKWELCRQAPGSEKYFICNADEGDPGAFMDRSILEGTPHAVIEGMQIAAYAIGADNGIVYVRAEYPIAVKRIRNAIKQAEEAGLLGEKILGTDFSFQIEVRMGAGAFVCGEETALIASLEGLRGMPRPRPPFPAQSGYRGKPTNINNVETIANVPLIINKGKEWYRSTGTEKSKGTKIFALAGKVNNTGLVEVPMGTTLREIVFGIGGGIPKKRAFKAAQMGGPSGGCVPARYLDLPVDYESVKAVGAIMGSGGLIVMDEGTCAVDIARFFIEFVQEESCGKCVPCRIGTAHMLEILNRICAGRGEAGDIERLEELAAVIKETSLCGLGQTAPNPVLSTLKYFREEYNEHIYRKHCRAAVCEKMFEAPCVHICPAGINVPHYIGLIGEGKPAQAMQLIRRRNPFVSVCGRVCDAPCEQRCRRGQVDASIAIRALKRYAQEHTENPAASDFKPAAGKAEVAVVGSGPAGLSCAYFLALMGRRSVVYEELPVPGGALATAIPAYRLPPPVLKTDIDYILSHGVELHVNTRVTDVEGLFKQGFKAVFVATGASRGRLLGIEGEKSKGVFDALEFLKSAALGKPPHPGKQVAVIGGGNAAIDAARTVLRLGAEQVSVLYRRTREEMPAYAEEIQAAGEEGITIMELVAPVAVTGKAGKVTALQLIRMRPGETDAEGRRRPVPVEGSTFSFSCDMVIAAVGQEVDTGPFCNALELHSWGGIKVDPLTYKTSAAAVFAGGDCVTGGATVIKAVQAGQAAACAIDKKLGGEGKLPPHTGTSYTAPVETGAETGFPRAVEPELPVETRIRTFSEVLGTLPCDTALTETARCLRCDLEKGK